MEHIRGLDGGGGAGGGHGAVEAVQEAAEGVRVFDWAHPGCRKRRGKVLSETILHGVKLKGLRELRAIVLPLVHVMRYFY